MKRNIQIQELFSAILIQCLFIHKDDPCDRNTQGVSSLQINKTNKNLIALKCMKVVQESCISE